VSRHVSRGFNPPRILHGRLARAPTTQIGKHRPDPRSTDLTRYMISSEFPEEAHAAEEDVGGDGNTTYHVIGGLQI
jgi:hypothetical protein